MASLRLPCSPSTPHIATEQHQTFHKIPLFSSFHKPINYYTHLISTNYNAFLSRSPIRTKRVGHFLLHLSSTTQYPAVEEKGVEEEEFSRTRLLAQNIPWTCTPEDVRSLFEKFGTVLDVELSMHSKNRNRGLAFVSMGSPEEAATALTSLESFEFQGRSLKMNYAKLKRKKPSPSPPPSKPAPTFNLFIANLPFEAKAKDVKEFFNAEGANIVSVEIVYHENPRRPSGYGFVAFKTKKEADAALTTFSEKMFMGRPIRVARSRQFVREARKESLKSDDSSTELDSNVEQADKAEPVEQKSGEGNEIS